MTQPSRPGEEYREQLARYARELAAARHRAVHNDLDGGGASGVMVFVSANRKKRLEQLRQELAALAPAFDDLDDLLAAYACERPLAPYCSITDDAERFLGWLEVAGDLEPVRRDFVACQRARHAVEAAGRADRRGHLRFQDLWSLRDQLVPELDSDPRLLVHLNPIRAWSRFETGALLDGDEPAPADVLFFAVREDVRAAVLAPTGGALVRELSSHGPCSLDDWAALTEHVDRAELVKACRDMAAMGLAAFG
jgi:hypothetical protein